MVGNRGGVRHDRGRVVGLEGSGGGRQCTGEIFRRSNGTWRYGPSIWRNNREHQELARDRSEGAELGGPDIAEIAEGA